MCYKYGFCDTSCCIAASYLCKYENFPTKCPKLQSHSKWLFDIHGNLIYCHLVLLILLRMSEHFDVHFQFLFNQNGTNVNIPLVVVCSLCVAYMHLPEECMCVCVVSWFCHVLMKTLLFFMYEENHQRFVWFGIQDLVAGENFMDFTIEPRHLHVFSDKNMKSKRN